MHLNNLKTSYLFLLLFNILSKVNSLVHQLSSKNNQKLQLFNPFKTNSRYIRKCCQSNKMPGDECIKSEECVDFGGITYYCIEKHCQLPRECPPGYAQVGPTCVSYAVTGGECLHPIQCLTGSVCINSKCRGPCDDNQLFIKDQCIDYEGAGCIDMSCIKGNCPQAFPSCNWIPQKKNYLCCERKIRISKQCPNSKSIPQINQETGEITECFDNNCADDYSCQFSKFECF